MRPWTSRRAESWPAPLNLIRLAAKPSTRQNATNNTARRRYPTVAARRNRGITWPKNATGYPAARRKNEDGTRTCACARRGVIPRLWDNVGGCAVYITLELGEPVADKLRSAYRLLRRFRAGEVRPGTPITRQQEKLVRLAAADLAVPDEKSGLPELVLAVARNDLHWNRRTQDCVNELYSLRESGRHIDEESVRTEFVEACPSSWYRSIVKAV